MQFKKENIVHILSILLVVGISFRILIPLILDAIRGKQLGLKKDISEFDSLIRQQKEILKAQFKNTSNNQSNTTNSPELAKIKNELAWGGNELGMDIKKTLLSLFGYQFSDTKIHAFLTLVEKRNYLDLSKSNQKESILNLLSSIFIILVIIDEIKEKDFSFTEKCAKKLKVPYWNLAIAIQIKLLKSNLKNIIKDERIFVDQFILSQFSDETINQCFDGLLKSESALWEKSISHLFEELSLCLKFANILSPLSPPKHKQDFENAHKALTVSEKDLFEDIKKQYKALALQYHPDRIVPQKFPPLIEKKAIQKFKIIQESFDIISNRK